MGQSMALPGSARRARTAARRASALAAGLLALAAATQPAAALRLFGACVIGPCAADAPGDGLVDPKPYEVTIAVASDDPGLEAALRGASALWRGRAAPAAGSAGLLARARGDYRRLLAALYDEARYGGEISIRADGREVADLPAGHAFADDVLIEIAVTPAPPFTFGRTDIDNPPPATADPGDRVESPADIGFAPGLPARAGVIRRAGEAAVEGWRQQGHPEARLAERHALADHADRTLGVSLGIAPGPRAVYGPVAVTGAQRMRPGFIAAQTGIEPGRAFDPDDLERARTRLRRLGVFGTAAVGEAGTVGADGVLPVAVAVDERKPRRIGIGARFSTIEGLGAEAYWLHRNLAGRAERLRLEASVGGVDGIDPGDYDYRLGATLGLPGRFTPDTDLELAAFAEREVLAAYTRTGGEIAIGVTHHAAPALTYSGSLFAEYAAFEDGFGTRRFGLVGATAGLVRDTRDDARDPRAGLYLAASLTPFYEWAFANAGVRLDGEARAYLAFGEDERTVLAGRFRLGSILGPNASGLPPDLLYFAGGGASVRGYGHRSIGAGGAGGASAVGGRSLLETGAEVRQAVTGRIALVGFVDAAIVGADSAPGAGGTALAGAGIGARYGTGLGPIRVDVAFPLNRRPQDGLVAFYAGIGQAF